MSLTCLTCNQHNINEVVENNRRYYLCRTCNKLYERARDSRYGKDVAITTKDGATHHVCIGALIRLQDKILLLKRRSYPYGYDIPAGHVEYGETPEQAAKREIFEETGLRVKDPTLIYNGVLKGNKCRYGAENHIYYFYEYKAPNEHPILSDESESVGWYTPEEIGALALVSSARVLLSMVMAL
jgi:8-oxo-dGTP diphosphatase